MYNVFDFIAWALTHADPATIPNGAMLSLQKAECGTEPWHYLFGSTRVQTNKNTLDRYYNQHYCKTMTRAQYDSLTAGWKPTDYATDCQGLLDAYLTYEKGEKTDINADMNYRYWCEDNGEIGAVDRPYIIGEAVFMARFNGSMHHVGWVCGFMPDGEPLVVEARGIAYGVVVTRFNSRNWTHRGLMTAKFDYTEKDEVSEMIKADFTVTSPMHKGEAYLKMQQALNAAGYTDADGKQLEEDGKWGKCSQAAFDALIADYAKAPEIPLLLEFAASSKDGGYALRATVAKIKEGNA